MIVRKKYWTLFLTLKTDQLWCICRQSINDLGASAGRKSGGGSWSNFLVNAAEWETK
jgi:hypothetical protein